MHAGKQQKEIPLGSPLQFKKIKNFHFLINTFIRIMQRGSRFFFFKLQRAGNTANDYMCHRNIFCFIMKKTFCSFMTDIVWFSFEVFKFIILRKRWNDRCWERLRARGEGGNREWDGRMVALTLWTWVWARSRRVKDRKAWCAAVCGLSRVGHDLVTEHQQLINLISPYTYKDTLWGCCRSHSYIMSETECNDL